MSGAAAAAAAAAESPRQCASVGRLRVDSEWTRGGLRYSNNISCRIPAAAAAAAAARSDSLNSQCRFEEDFKRCTEHSGVRTVEVQAVEGMAARFPCDLASPNNDKVYMVFWFRDDAGIPLYSFDVRGKPLSEARHWSAPEVFGPRAHFAPSPAPAALLVRDVKRRDEGVYRCRVDFRNTQTTSFRYNLTVVVPPERPVVVDRWGRVINATTLGPHEEGDDVLLTCRVLGGRPEPSVRWLVNGVLVDEEYEHNTGDVIENRLLWPAVSRADYAAVFTCQAANSQLVPPREVSLVLDMFLRPLTVEIKKPSSLGEEEALTAERRYEVACESAGSRPPALLSWYKGKRQLKRITPIIESVQNFSQHKLVLGGGEARAGRGGGGGASECPLITASIAIISLIRSRAEEATRKFFPNYLFLAPPPLISAEVPPTSQSDELHRRFMINLDGQVCNERCSCTRAFLLTGANFEQALPCLRRWVNTPAVFVRVGIDSCSVACGRRWNVASALSQHPRAITPHTAHPALRRATPAAQAPRSYSQTRRDHTPRPITAPGVAIVPELHTIVITQRSFKCIVRFVRRPHNAENMFAIVSMHNDRRTPRVDESKSDSRFEAHFVATRSRPPHYSQEAHTPISRAYNKSCTPRIELLTVQCDEGIVRRDLLWPHSSLVVYDFK
ncbi:hypothetical protein JYU34_002095, partial [Plutella xylostella]